MAVAMRAQNGSPGKGCGKAAPWKSLKADFSTALGNPAKGAGFPLSHSPDGGGPSTMKRTYRVLRKPDILTCYRHQFGCRLEMRRINAYRVSIVWQLALCQVLVG